MNSEFNEYCAREGLLQLRPSADLSPLDYLHRAFSTLHGVMAITRSMGGAPDPLLDCVLTDIKLAREGFVTEGHR